MREAQFPKPVLREIVRPERHILIAGEGRSRIM
jgi:hypothetical protein